MEGTTVKIHVSKRPGVDNFIRRVSEFYELVLYTASMPKYANALLDKLDPYKLIRYRLFREHCTLTPNGFVKDLSRLGRSLKDVIILDNSPCAYSFQPLNAIPIKTWFDDETDTQLNDLFPLLELLAKVGDVREYLRRLIPDNYSSYEILYKLFKTNLKPQAISKPESKLSLINCWIPQQGRTITSPTIQQSQLSTSRYNQTVHGVMGDKFKNSNSSSVKRTEVRNFVTTHKTVSEDKRSEHSHSKSHKARTESEASKHYYKNSRGSSVQAARDLKKVAKEKLHQNETERKQWASGSMRHNGSCKNSLRQNKETFNDQNIKRIVIEIPQSYHNKCREPMLALKRASMHENSKENEQNRLRSSLTISTTRLNSLDGAISKPSISLKHINNGLSTTKRESHKREARLIQFQDYKMREIMGTVIPRNYSSHNTGAVYERWGTRYKY